MGAPDTHITTWDHILAVLPYVAPILTALAGLIAGSYHGNRERRRADHSLANPWHSRRHRD